MKIGSTDVRTLIDVLRRAPNDSLNITDPDNLLFMTVGALHHKAAEVIEELAVRADTVSIKIRYKNGGQSYCSRFNMHGVGEVLTNDDSVLISEVDVWLPTQQCWKSMSQAFVDHDIIPDNHNTWFGEPRNAEDRQRGYFA